jgi:hypothetical protein
MVWAAPVCLFAATGDLFAQTSVEFRVQKLEETIQALERRVASLEEALRERHASPNTNSDNASWRKLRKGMSTADVEKLLGSPSKIIEFGSFASWFYDSSSGHGTVRFGGKSRVLESWTEP